MASSASSIKVFHYQYPPKTTCFPYLYSEKFNVLRIKRGMVRVVIGAEGLNASMGDLVFLPPKKVYSVMSGPSPIEFDLVRINISSFINETDVLREFLPALGEGRVKLDKLCYDISVRASIDSIANARDLGSIEVVSAVYRFFYLLLSKCNAEIISCSEKSIISAENYIYENLDKELKAKQIAEKFGFCEAYFCRKFKKVTGLSVLQYIKILRLSKSLEPLREGTTVKKVAKLCGFSDTNYFTRLFKQHFGLPPTHFKGKKNAILV